MNYRYYARTVGICLLACLAIAQVGVGATATLQSMPALGTSFLESEAGITAFSQVGRVNLIQAAQAFKYIEYQTGEFIIGVVELEDYAESHDVHVYLDVAGWVAAYYLANEPASKIVDWKDYGGSVVPSKLEDALIAVVTQINQGLPYINYYDFRYPDATKISIITDECGGTGTGSFNLLIPGTYTVYSRTWSHALQNTSSNWGTTGHIAVDGTVLNSGGNRSTGGSYWWIWNDTMSPNLLSPDVWHEVTVANNYGSYGNHYVAIVLIYAE